LLNISFFKQINEWRRNEISGGTMSDRGALLLSSLSLRSRERETEFNFETRGNANLFVDVAAQKAPFNSHSGHSGDRYFFLPFLALFNLWGPPSNSEITLGAASIF